MAQSETILTENTHPSDSSIQTVTGEKYKGDGYYGRSDGLHTAQINYTGFTGTINLQATLAIDPADADWFTVYTTILAQETDNVYTNFTGNYVWIRAQVIYTDGTVNSIVLNH